MRVADSPPDFATPAANSQPRPILREAAGSRLIQLLIVAAISIALLAYGIDRATVAAPFTDTVSKLRAQDESGYANSALALARDGGWLTPKVLGRYFLYKPPLLVWLSGLCLKLFGISLWALRLPKSSTLL